MTTNPVSLQPCGPYGPRTPSGVIQSTFSMYREQPKLVFGLILIVAVVQLAAVGVISVPKSQFANMQYGAMLPLQMFLYVCMALLGWVLVYLVTQVVHGAYFYAVTAQLEARSTDISEAGGLALGQLGRLIGVSVGVGLRVLGYMLLLVAAPFLVVFSLIYGIALRGLAHLADSPMAVLLVVLLILLFFAAFVLVYLWLLGRYAIAVPACLAEDLPATAAIRRSVHLSAKSRGRIYAIYGTVLLLAGAFLMLLLPVALLTMRGGGHTSGALLANALVSAGNLLFGAWLTSFIGIATTLCYYDLRARKEGLGVGTGPSGEGPVSAPPSSSGPPSQTPATPDNAM